MSVRNREPQKSQEWQMGKFEMGIIKRKPGVPPRDCQISTGCGQSGHSRPASVTQDRTFSQNHILVVEAQMDR